MLQYPANDFSLAVVNLCRIWYITDGGIYGNRLQNIYLDHKWNCVAFADAGLCSICGYNFGLLELDNFAIDLRGITFLQLETQDKKDTLSVGYYQISIIQIMLHACRMKCFTTMVVNILLLISSILCIPSQELTP